MATRAREAAWERGPRARSFNNRFWEQSRQTPTYSEPRAGTPQLAFKFKSKRAAALFHRTLHIA